MKSDSWALLVSTFEFSGVAEVFLPAAVGYVLGSVFDAVAVFDGEEVFFGVRNGVEGFPGFRGFGLEDFGGFRSAVVAL